jgi:PilZ domain
MAEKAARAVGPLAETQYDLDTREVPRFGCQQRPMIKIMVRPSFRAADAAVRDISVKGIGLVCAGPIPPGSCLAVLWDFGRPDTWRTLRARVARTTPCPRGGWIIGCAFEQRLAPTDIEAFFGTNPKLTRGGRRD